MRVRKIVGVALLVISLVLLVIVVRQVRATVVLTGLQPGAQAVYTPPFAHQGLLVILAGVCSAAALLIGLFLLGPRRNRSASPKHPSRQSKAAAHIGTAAQSIDKVDALPSKVSKQTFDGNINFL